MGSISTQSIFQSSTSPKSWRSHAGSIAVHGVLLLLALTITIPAVRPVQKAKERITLLAPVLPEYKVKITAPPRRVTPSPIPVKPKLAPAPLAPKALQLPAPKPEPIKPAVLAAAPEVKSVPQPAPAVEVKPELKPELPATPKPSVQTGVFQQAIEQAKNTPSGKLTTGGFGDRNGAAPSANSRPGLTTAKVGAFDAPDGSGSNGGAGRSQTGAVKQSAFGNGGFASAGAQAGGNGVQASGFDDSTSAQVHKKNSDANAAQAFSPVEVLSKPRPVYTAEARNLRVEGHVSLEVVFLSNGSVRVVRVVHGLGHGLDEAAQQAALQVRFKPAMRGGVAVDTDATIDITFELT